MWSALHLQCSWLVPKLKKWIQFSVRKMKSSHQIAIEWKHHKMFKWCISNWQKVVFMFSIPKVYPTNSNQKKNQNYLCFWSHIRIHRANFHSKQHKIFRIGSKKERHWNRCINLDKSSLPKQKTRRKFIFYCISIMFWSRN